MLAAMGIDVYRLRNRAASVGDAVQIFIDAQTRVCVRGAHDATALAWLARALRVPVARITLAETAAGDGVMLDEGALPRAAAAKRKLWQSLKPLARQLQNPA